MTTQEVDRHSN